MENIEIGLVGGQPLPIKKGLPSRYKSHTINNADCYYIEVAKGEYILFQHLCVGPYACWYTEYLFNGPKTLYCKMKSEGVEFHTMIEGAAMYNMDNKEKWYRESAGVYNILVNPPAYTKTAFSTIPIRTFDIHISRSHFNVLARHYPRFKKLLPALKSGETGTLYPGKEQSGLELRFQISQIFQLLAHHPVLTKETELDLIAHFEAIISSYASNSKSKITGFNIRQSEIDTILNIKNYIQKHYADHQVIAEAQHRFPIAPEKLKKCFMILFSQKPKELLILERIHRAKLFIERNPSASRQEIAMAVGYLDANYLNNLFLKHASIGLEEYRQASKERSAG